MGTQGTQNTCLFLQLPGRFVLVLGCALFFFLPHAAHSKPHEFDPILIYVAVPKLGGTEIPGLIDRQTLYLSVTDLFAFLKIKAEAQPGGTIDGFVLHQLDLYTISLGENSITYKGLKHRLSPGALQEFEGNLYLQISAFGDIFGLPCQFDFRNLHVKLDASQELPIFKQIRQELMRKNLGKGQLYNPDTAFRPKYALFDFEGMDWNLTFNKWMGLAQGEEQLTTGTTGVQSRGFVSMGGELAYGNFNARINWFGNSELTFRNVDLRWKRVLTSQNALRQITLGRINGSSFATLFQPLTGVRLTNAPPVARKSFGFHTIRDFARPFWIVELYLNNELIEYLKTDETGLYHFEIPLNYGSNKLQLKLFGPSGEEELIEETVFIPFLLLPKKELIYQVNAGVVPGSGFDKFDKLANAQLSYGMTRTFTIGAGMEYYTGLGDRLFISRFTTTNKLGNNVLLSTEWMPDLKASGVLNARTKSGIILDLSYENLAKGQKAFPQLNYLSLSRISAMIPFRVSGKRYNSRINFTELSYPNSKTQTLLWSLNGTLFGAMSNFSTLVSKYREAAFVTTTIQQTYRLPANLLLNGRIQVNYQRMDYSSLMLGLEKRLQSGLRLNTFYQVGFTLQNSLMGLGLRYDLGVFQGTTNSRLQGDQLMLNQALMGSVIQDQVTGNLNFSSRSELGRASLSIVPFLDINDNNVKDNEEPYEFELSVKVKGASSAKDPKSGITRVKNLVPYQDYLIELDENSLPEISWRLDHKKIQIGIKPGNSNELEVPIKVVNEIAGKVVLNDVAQGGIRVLFYNQDHNLIKELVSQRDGSFYHSELKAGTYTFRPDTAQLIALEMAWESVEYEIHFEQGSFGDYSAGWEIKLTKKGGQTPTPNSPEKIVGTSNQEIQDSPSSPSEILGAKPVIQPQAGEIFPTKDSTPNNGDKVLPVLKEHSAVYRIQVQASKVMLDAFQLSRLPDSVQHRKENGWHKYFIGSFESFVQAEQFLQRSISQVYRDAFVVYQFTGDSLLSTHFPGEYRLPGTDENYFKVQIFASKKPISTGNSLFSSLTPEEEMHQGLYKYLIGARMTIQEAQALRATCVALGFADAMIVEYSGGLRLVK
jgi:hypothetical protein